MSDEASNETLHPQDISLETAFGYVFMSATGGDMDHTYVLFFKPGQARRMAGLLTELAEEAEGYVR